MPACLMTLAPDFHFRPEKCADTLGSVGPALVKLSVEMATDHELAQPKAWSMGVAGWCVAENGELEKGLGLATQAIVEMQLIHSRHFLPYLFGLLADVHFKAGHEAAATKAVQGRTCDRRSHRRMLL